MASTPRYQLTYMATSSINKESLFNEALAKLDAMVNPFAFSLSTTAPPGSPSVGDVYIIPAGATGAWAGQDDKIAVYTSGWIFIDPPEGILVYVQDEANYYTFDGSTGGWSVYALSITQLNDVPDVDTTGIATNDFLIWNGVSYVPATLTGATLYEESDGTFTVAIAASGGTLEIFDGGSSILAGVQQINFTGNGVVAEEGTGGTDRVRVRIPGLTLSQNGSVVNSQVTEINFSGAGVDVYDYSDGTLDVVVSGGGGGGSVPTPGSGDGGKLLAVSDDESGYELVQPAASLASENLVTNGDFEAGDLTGWTVDGGTPLVEVYASGPYDPGYPASEAGTYIVSGGGNASAGMYQDVFIDPTVYPVLEFDATMYVNDATQADSVTITFEQRDASDNVLTSLEKTLASPGTLRDDFYREVIGADPNLSYVRITVSFTRGTSGSYINCMVDNISIRGYGLFGLSGTSPLETTNKTSAITLVATDFGVNKLMRVNSGSDVIVYVPDGMAATEPLAFVQEGAGQIIFVADGTSVNIKAPDSADRTRVQYSSAVLIPDTTDDDSYWLAGDVTTA